MLVGQHCTFLLSLTLLCFLVHHLWESGVWSFTRLTDPVSSSRPALVLISSQGRFSCPESVCLGSLEDCLPCFLRYCISRPLMQGTQSPLKLLTFPLALGPHSVPTHPRSTQLKHHLRCLRAHSWFFCFDNELIKCTWGVP